MYKVSIVVPTFNRPERVLEAIQSCLAQTYLPYEIIIGDDSQNDLTKNAIARLQQTTPVTIRYFNNRPALKQAANTNMLFNSARGDKALLLHDDDLLLPEALEILINCFKENPEIDIAFGKQYIISDDGTISLESSKIYNTDYYRSAEFEGSILTPLEAGFGQQFPNNGYMINTHIVKEIQFRTYDSANIPLGNGCEYDFGVRLGERGCKMYFINQYLGKYRISTVSMSRSKSDDSAYQAFMILKGINVSTKRANAIKSRRLFDKAPIAITQAVDLGKKKDALAIYLSEWYRKKTLSLPGVKRLLYIMFW